MMKPRMISITIMAAAFAAVTIAADGVVVAAFQTAKTGPGTLHNRQEEAFGVSESPSILSLHPGSYLSSKSPRMFKLSLLATAFSELDTDLDPHNTENIALQQNTWMFQNKYPIAYEVARNIDFDVNKNDVEVVPILLLNGFGVGSFHQHRLMRQLLLEHNAQQQQKQQQQYVIYGIDYLGQGKSWPADCDDGNSKDELNLGYSADMWLDQVKGFIDEVIIPSSSLNNKKVHLAGNSVGGYLATILTSRHPHMISSLTLMNATPVWGLNLPGWDGKLPAPPFPKMVGRIAFNTIRNLDVIDKYLEAAYVYRAAFDGTYDDSFHGCSDGIDDCALPAKIQGCTEGKGGHAAFASILWSAPASERRIPAGSPPTPTDFYGALGRLPVDVLLLFGDDDAWCTPPLAKRMHTTLDSRDGSDPPAQRYITIENAGHCPGHEAPTAVARTLLSWIGASNNDDEGSDNRSKVPLVSSASAEIREPWGVVRVREVSIEESQDLSVADRIVSSMVG